ncbi:Hint domain-containing protein [Roseicyclus marinus]|uniref:Hint domain-containing protein n=1 Tax=Roseicyclus marinus TaxID=2161673 RepID=UPI00240FA05D|nr:Hint domain-containing protein [Roseicyclus marinus]MDG3042920.1 Hint domain-containing protein [Roseicyclus marinus]
MTDLISLAAGLRVDDMGAGAPMAIAPGTPVLTLDGALPIEHLYPGDRLVTRHGARALVAIDRVTLMAGTPIVQVTKNALGGRPERDLWLPATQRLVIRDWRAKALYGQAQVCIPAGQLADGEFIRLTELAEDVTGFALRFGRPEVFYADGLELASADVLTIPA